MASKKPSSKTKPKETPKRGRGRPRKEISAVEVQALAGIGCTEEEISRVKGISVDTLHRNYAEAYQKGFATMQMSLRRRQMRAALAGSNVMMIWLGKQYLGQRDRNELMGKDGTALTPGSIVFVMPKNNRDGATATPVAPASQPKPVEPAPLVPVADVATPAPASPAVPPAPPPLTPAQIAGTAEVDEDRPRPRYSHGGRDPRVAENIHSLKPIGPAGGPAASTGKR
jgi:hypothetical protein